MKSYLAYICTIFLLAAQTCFAQMDPPEEPVDLPPDNNGSQMMMSKGRMRHRGEFGERMNNRTNKYIEEMEKYQPGIKTEFDKLRIIAEKKHDRKCMRDVFDDVHLMFRLAKDNNDIKKVVSESTKLEIESLLLADKITSAKKTDDVESIKKELKEKLDAAFEKKQELRKMRLDHLEKMLQETKDEVKFRTENKDKIIDQRYNQLINADSSMEW